MSTTKFIILICLFFSGELYCQKDTKDNSHLTGLYKYSLHQVLKQRENKNYKLSQDAIPDSMTAIKVADVLLTKRYGTETIESEKPFTAILLEGYWIVYGNLPEGYSGGVAEIFMKKNTGEVIRLVHTK